jgi:hypothetical protein
MPFRRDTASDTAPHSAPSLRPASASPLGLSGYADLPDEVLQQVLERTAEVADGVRALFSRVGERRGAMRDALLAAGNIRRAADLPQPAVAPTVAAVDGGAAIEKSLGADTALAVAVGIEGLTDAGSVHWPGVQYASWQRTLAHEGEETAVVCRGVMSALELAVLRDAPHDVVLLDGSHLTPIIALNAALGVEHEGLRAELTQQFAFRETASALRIVAERSSIVAIVKYDGSRDLAQTWLPSELRGPGLGLDDRTTMSLLLEEGEYTAPQPVALTQQSQTSWTQNRIEALSAPDEHRESVRLAVNEVIAQVKGEPVSGLLVTYYKPHSWSPAFRLEIKTAVASSPDRLATVFAGIRSQVVSPEIREPYPQWVADRMAKSVGDALVALRAAVNFDLADGGFGEYVSMVAHSYRTEAV